MAIQMTTLPLILHHIFHYSFSFVFLTSNTLTSLTIMSGMMGEFQLFMFISCSLVLENGSSPVLPMRACGVSARVEGGGIGRNRR